MTPKSCAAAATLEMPRTVTELKHLAKDPGWVQVHLDGQPVFAVRILDAAHLKVGQTLNREEIAQLTATDLFRRSYSSAIRFLGPRPRSRKEVERHLQEKGFGEATVNGTIARLSKERYIDDREFAFSWVRQRSRLKPRSRLALRQELTRKGICSEIIDSALDTVDEYEMACKAVDRRMKTWVSTERSKLKTRVLRYLNNKGYSCDIARKAYRHLRDCLEDRLSPVQR